MRTLYLLAAALLALPAAATGTYMGCYTAIPSDSKSMGSNTYQLSSSCSGSCSGYLYFAMSVLDDSQVCSCFNDAPLSSDEGGTCSTMCNGWPEELCGGSLVWSVYAMEGVAVLVAPGLQNVTLLAPGLQNATLLAPGRHNATLLIAALTTALLPTSGLTSALLLTSTAHNDASPAATKYAPAVAWTAVLGAACVAFSLW